MTLYNEGSIWCEDSYMSMILLVNEVLGTDFEPSDIYYSAMYPCLEISDFMGILKGNYKPFAKELKIRGCRFSLISGFSETQKEDICTKIRKTALWC